MSDRKSRYWAFVIYPDDSAPDNWLSILNEYHLPMAVSPLHDADLNADGEEKKKHRHVLIAYGNTTTAGNIKEISQAVGGTIPIPVVSLKGYYRYLTHKDNPEKAQYREEDIIHIAGFDPADYWSYTAEEEVTIRIKVMEIIKGERIFEYFGLLDYLMGYDLALFKYVSEHTLLFNSVVTSFRHSCKVDDEKNVDD